MTRLFHTKQMLQLISVQFKEIIREPGILFWGIAFPILMSLGLGIAFTKKADSTRKLAIVENYTTTNISRDTNSRLATYFKNNHYKLETDRDGYINYEIILPDEVFGNSIFHIVKTSWPNAMALLKRGKINMIMMENNRKLEYHFDPTNPDAQLTYLKLTKVFRSKEVVLKSTGDIIKPLTVSGTRYIDFLVPGLIAMGVMMSCMWGISYGIIEKRSRKFLRRMVATPMKKSHFLISLMTVRILMNFIESALLFLFAFLVFDISIKGSIPAMITIFIAGNICFAGIAIFISSHTAKTEIGNGYINLVVMPMMILSGIFFSYHNFPDWCISFIEKLPLTMLADGIRSISIEGAGFSEVSLISLILVTIGVAFFSIGLKIFKWH